ncbi:hypothetical protein Anapl_15324 [Anas platyrhynchos]|uniref:Uncharacterized protein n=1 Tax=Anas platyrhynchos TaxID=8839 RepID=R0JYI3_ANAPL|nr:hypothetical protein Anapl_15324 [Anas platyrhynchos]
MVSRYNSSKMRFGDHVDLSLDISYNTDIATAPLQGSKIYSMRDYSTGRGEIICNSCGELQPVLQFTKGEIHIFVYLEVNSRPVSFDGPQPNPPKSIRNGYPEIKLSSD